MSRNMTAHQFINHCFGRDVTSAVRNDIREQNTLIEIEIIKKAEIEELNSRFISELEVEPKKMEK